MMSTRPSEGLQRVIRAIRTRGTSMNVACFNGYARIIVIEHSNLSTMPPHQCSLKRISWTPILDERASSGSSAMIGANRSFFGRVGRDRTTHGMHPASTGPCMTQRTCPPQLWTIFRPSLTSNRKGQSANICTPALNKISEARAQYYGLVTLIDD